MVRNREAWLGAVELALAALDGGAGCSLHKNIQLGSEGLRKGNLFEIHTVSYTTEWWS